jgi:hypothetical protein
MGTSTSKLAKKKQSNQKITNRSVKISEKEADKQSTVCFTPKLAKKKRSNQKITNRSVKINEKRVDEQSVAKKRPNEEQAKDTIEKEWKITSDKEGVIIWDEKYPPPPPGTIYWTYDVTETLHNRPK